MAPGFRISFDGRLDERAGSSRFVAGEIERAANYAGLISVRTCLLSSAVSLLVLAPRKNARKLVDSFRGRMEEARNAQSRSEGGKLLDLFFFSVIRAGIFSQRAVSDRERVNYRVKLHLTVTNFQATLISANSFA